MSGLETASISLIWQIIRGLAKAVDESDTSSLRDLAIQVQRDLNYANECLKSLDATLLPHQPTKRWFRQTIMTTQTALKDFEAHLPKMVKGHWEHNAFMRAKYYFLNHTKTIDLEKRLKYAHSALLAGISVVYQVIIYKSLVPASTAAPISRTLCTPPVRQNRMTGEIVL